MKGVSGDLPKILLLPEMGDASVSGVVGTALLHLFMVIRKILIFSLKVYTTLHILLSLSIE